MNAAIDTWGLHKRFADKVAVKDLTLQVARGEVFGFLGPNGAGKTTSIKMLLGLVAPTSGSAYLLGRPLGERETRAKIGYLPEHFRFHEWLRADEFLQLHGKLYGMSRSQIAAKIPELLDLVGLSGRRQSQLSDFSKGMLQRIGLAQALLNDPELVFLDEPTSGLDPLGRRLVRDIISRLRAQGAAVFLNSHLLSEVELSCDRVAFVRNGELLQVSTMAALQQSALQLTVRVGQPDAACTALLSQYGRLLHDTAENGCYLLAIEEETAVPILASALVTAGYNLYELQSRRQTLEEKFVEIIGEDYDA